MAGLWKGWQRAGASVLLSGINARAAGSKAGVAGGFRCPRLKAGENYGY